MNRVPFFHLPFPPTVNTLFANGGGRRFKTKAYSDWIVEAGLILNTHHIQPFAGPVWIDFQLHRPDKHRRDATNYLKAPEDLLVRHGIIKDDSLVVGGSFKWVGAGEFIWLRIRDATKREIADALL